MNAECGKDSRVAAIRREHFFFFLFLFFFFFETGAVSQLDTQKIDLRVWFCICHMSCCLFDSLLEEYRSAPKS